MNLQGIKAQTWVEKWTKLDSKSIEKYRYQYINHSDITDFFGLSFQTFTFNAFNLIMPIFVIVLQHREESTNSEKFEKGLGGYMIAQLCVSVLMIAFYMANTFRDMKVLNYLIHLLEFGALIFIFIAGGKPDLIIKEGTLA